MSVQNRRGLDRIWSAKQQNNKKNFNIDITNMLENDTVFQNIIGKVAIPYYALCILINNVKR